MKEEKKSVETHRSCVQTGHASLRSHNHTIKHTQFNTFIYIPFNERIYAQMYI